MEKEEEFDKDQSKHKAKEDQSKAEANNMRLRVMESLKRVRKEGLKNMKSSCLRKNEAQKCLII